MIYGFNYEMSVQLTDLNSLHVHPDKAGALMKETDGILPESAASQKSETSYWWFA